jgi:hypothetical protein
MVDTAVLGFLEAITGTGVSAAAFASTLAKTHGHHRAIASLVAESAIDEWCPFIDAGMPSGRWHDLADTVDRLREVGVAAQSYMFARARRGPDRCAGRGSGRTEKTHARAVTSTDRMSCRHDGA